MLRAVLTQWLKRGDWPATILLQAPAQYHKYDGDFDVGKLQHNDVKLMHIGMQKLYGVQVTNKITKRNVFDISSDLRFSSA